MGDQIFVNNRRVDGNIRIGLDGETYEGFTEVSYGSARKMKKSFGLTRNRGVQSLTPGFKDTEDFSLKGPFESVRAFLRALSAKAPLVNGKREVGQVAFPITVEYGGETSTYVDQVNGCRISGHKSGVPAADSEDAVVEELTGMCKEVVLDGDIVI